MEQINSVFGRQTLEEMFDGLRQDGSDWATAQLATLNKMVNVTEFDFILVIFITILFSKALR